MSFVEYRTISRNRKDAWGKGSMWNVLLREENNKTTWRIRSLATREILTV